MYCRNIHALTAKFNAETAHSAAIKSICFTDGDSTLYTGSLDRSIKIWRMAAGMTPTAISVDGEVTHVNVESGNLLWSQSMIVEAVSPADPVGIVKMCNMGTSQQITCTVLYI